MATNDSSHPHSCIPLLPSRGRIELFSLPWSWAGLWHLVTSRMKQKWRCAGSRLSHVEAWWLSLLLPWSLEPPYVEANHPAGGRGRRPAPSSSSTQLRTQDGRGKPSWSFSPQLSSRMSKAQWLQRTSGGAEEPLSRALPTIQKREPMNPLNCFKHYVLSALWNSSRSMRQLARRFLIDFVS